MSLPDRHRPTPPSVLALWRRPSRKSPPAIIFGQDLTRPAPEPEPTFAAELLWTAGGILGGLVFAHLIAAAIWGPAMVLHVLVANLTGQPL